MPPIGIARHYDGNTIPIGVLGRFCESEGIVSSISPHLLPPEMNTMTQVPMEDDCVKIVEHLDIQVPAWQFIKSILDSVPSVLLPGSILPFMPLKQPSSGIFEANRSW